MSYIDFLNNQLKSAESLVKSKPDEALRTILNEMPVREKKACGPEPKVTKPKLPVQKSQAEKDRLLFVEEMKKYEAELAPIVKAEEDRAKLYEETKQIAALNVLKLIQQVEKGKLAAAIKNLTDEERDILMKYVYRGFEEKENIDHIYLLTIHEEICKNSGLGPVIRSIHTRLEV